MGNSYNGHLTSREAGDLGSQMIKEDVSRKYSKVYASKSDF